MSDDSTPPRDYPAEKRRALFTLIAATFTFGIIAGAPNDASPVKPVAALIQLFATFALIVRWCRIDADQRQFVLWPRFTFFTVAFPGPVVMVPLYLLKSRGTAGLTSCFYFLAISTLVVALNLVAMFVGSRLGELR
jgi:CDP-diglyceride synthetase